MENNLAPQIFRDTRMLSIGEGANESLLAAMGRGLRLSDTLHTYLNAHSQGKDLAERIGQISNALETETEAGPYSGNVARAWHDTVRGRLVVAALELAHARTLAETETERWASDRFEEVCQEARQGSLRVAAALGPPHLRKQIENLRVAIGDLEHFAPDVDFAFDPLLSRDMSRRQSTDEKKELLRTLLKPRQAGGQG